MIKLKSGLRALALAAIAMVALSGCQTAARYKLSPQQVTEARAGTSYVPAVFSSGVLTCGIGSGVCNITPEALGELADVAIQCHTAVVAQLSAPLASGLRAGIQGGLGGAVLGPVAKLAFGKGISAGDYSIYGAGADGPMYIVSGSREQSTKIKETDGHCTEAEWAERMNAKPFLRASGLRFYTAAGADKTGALPPFLQQMMLQRQQ